MEWIKSAHGKYYTHISEPIEGQIIGVWQGEFTYFYASEIIQPYVSFDNRISLISNIQKNEGNIKIWYSYINRA